MYFWTPVDGRKLRSICLYKLISEGTLTALCGGGESGVAGGGEVGSGWPVSRGAGGSRAALGDAHELPTNIYPLLLTEAILQREPEAIEWVVSRWPMRVLRVYDVLPLEDCLEDDYLTLPFELGLGSDLEVSLADCLVLGLLKLRPEANLKIVDFSRFDRGLPLAHQSMVCAGLGGEGREVNWVGRYRSLCGC